MQDLSKLRRIKAPSVSASKIAFQYPDTGVSVSVTGDGGRALLADLMSREKTAAVKMPTALKINPTGMGDELKNAVRRASQASGPGDFMKGINEKVQAHKGDKPFQMKLNSEKLAYPTWACAYLVMAGDHVPGIDKEANVMQAFQPLLQQGRQALGGALEKQWKTRGRGAMRDLPGSLSSGIDKARGWIGENMPKAPAAPPQVPGGSNLPVPARLQQSAASRAGTAVGGAADKALSWLQSKTQKGTTGGDFLSDIGKGMARPSQMKATPELISPAAYQNQGYDVYNRKGGGNIVASPDAMSSTIRNLFGHKANPSGPLMGSQGIDPAKLRRLVEGSEAGQT
jgi:hypothetical protein